MSIQSKHLANNSWVTCLPYPMLNNFVNLFYPMQLMAKFDAVTGIEREGHPGCQSENMVGEGVFD